MINLNGPKWQGVVAAILATAVIGAALAQSPPVTPPSTAPQDFHQAMDAWRTWNETHPNIRAIHRTLRGLEALEEDPTTRFTKPQAKPLLAILETWRNKPVLTDTQAKIVNASLLKPLTKEQLVALTDEPEHGSRPGEHHGDHFGSGGWQSHGWGGGSGGAPGQPGKPAAAPAAPHDYNPLNPATLPFERVRAHSTQRLDAFILALKNTK